MMRKMSVLMAALMALSIAAAPASAGGREVRERGSCSAGSTWKLDVKKDNSRLEVEYEVDQGVSGDVWRVRIRQNGDRIFAGRRTTAGDSGSFDVSLRTRDRSGSDRFVARARNTSTDEVCRGTLTF
jgi:hypothetical protein